MDNTIVTKPPAAPTERREVPFASRLSTKLLFLTILFVLLAEILIFVPAISNMRIAWLRDRLNTAAAAAIVIDGLPQVDLPRPLQNSTLMATGTKAIVLHKVDMTRLIVVSEVPPAVNAQYDLSQPSLLGDALDALETLLVGGDQVFSVRGPIGGSPMEIELVMGDKALRAAMLVYMREILWFSIVISLITASLIFLVINRLLIRPVARMTASMQGFALDPANPASVLAPPRGSDELALAARHLADMQAELQKTIRQQKNLADLGLAVSKINHDMRNILSSAQLMSDRLADIGDPVVKGLASKLVRTLGRAIGYSSEVLAYGRASETVPHVTRLALRPLVEDAGEILGLSAGTEVSFLNEVPREIELDADAEQLFRVFYNLLRNAMQALESDGDCEEGKRITVTAQKNEACISITVDDNGPGMPPKARENLFSAFRGSARAGGTGLGLAISREIIEAHRGWIMLEEKQGRGTRFRIQLPERSAAG